MNCIAGLNQWVLSVGKEREQGHYQNKGPCETAAEHYLIVVMPLLICFTKHHEQAEILFFGFYDLHVFCLGFVILVFGQFDLPNYVALT
jgi:hypothetical protein